MSHLLSRIVESFAGLRVVVIGEAMLDSYIDGSTDRLCREAPVPIVRLTGRRDAPGGAANTAVNVVSLGARVDFLSVVGDDPEAALLRLTLGGLGDRHGPPPRRRFRGGRWPRAGLSPPRSSSSGSTRGTPGRSRRWPRPS